MATDPISALRNTSSITNTTKTSGSGSGFADALSQATGAAPKTAARQLEDYVNMTPEQRMRADLLKKLGLTEEDLAKVSVFRSLEADEETDFGSRFQQAIGN